MELILSIDAASSPGHALILNCEGDQVKVVDSVSGDFSALLLNSLSSSLRSLDVGNGNNITESQPLINLGSILELLRYKWSRVVICAAFPDLMTMNLELPFEDERALSKVVPIEVQDSVPFEVDEFVISHRLVGHMGGSSNDVLIGGLPKERVRTVLASCAAAHIEPVAIITPGSALGALTSIFPECQNGAVLLLFASHSGISMVYVLDGSVRSERFLRADSPHLPALFRQFLGSTFRRYGYSVERIFMVGDPHLVGPITESLGRDVEYLPYPHDSEGIHALAALAATFGREDTKIEPAINFRTKEFSFNPVIKEVQAGIRKSLPYFGLALLLLIVSALITYIAREAELKSYQNEIIAAISKELPDLPLEPGKEAESLDSHIKTLERQLSLLGTSNSLTPLEAFAILSREFPSDSGLVVRQLTIQTGKILFQGTAPDYGAVERLERKLKQLKKYFCRVKKDPLQGSAGQADKRGFSFEIIPCS